MERGSGPVAITSRLTLALCVALLAACSPGRETCFDRLGGSGPNSNTSRLDTFIDVPADQWPAVAGMLNGYATERGWLVDQGDGSSDPGYRWLDMCDRVTIVRASNQQGGGGPPIGFGIIHMAYDGPANDGWRPVYRELHRRLEARWPGRLSYIEGEFGQRIGRPGWVDPPAPPAAAPGDQPEGNAAR